MVTKAHKKSDYSDFATLFKFYNLNLTAIFSEIVSFW
jgi:hypothetical protein